MQIIKRIQSLLGLSNKRKSLFYQGLKKDILYIDFISKEFGSEQFAIKNQQYNFYPVDDDLWELSFQLHSAKELVRDKELKEVLDALPNLEATVLVPEHQIDLYQGQHFYQQSGYDYATDEYMTNFYYFEHETIEHLEIELLLLGENSITAAIQGEVNINNNRSNEPDARIKVLTTFRLNDAMERGVM